MRLFRLFRGRRLGLAVNLVAAAFILASAAMPFGHHSLDCHLKSLTHCTSCTVGAGARLAHDQGALVPMPRRDAGPALTPPPAALNHPRSARHPIAHRPLVVGADDSSFVSFAREPRAGVALIG